MNYPVIIVGAGLSGLHAASLLHARGISCKVLEARNRIGGRVLSTSISDQSELGTFDLGPTWFWPQYENAITNIAQELNLETFIQYTQGAMLLERSLNESPVQYVQPAHANVISIRFHGGVMTLIEAIADTIPSGTIELNSQVKAIHLDPSGMVKVEAELADGTKERFYANAVILALPPRIAARHVEFAPLLPSELVTDLVNKPTWMAGQAKAVVVYDRPFWREKGLSGFISSRVGPLQEIHDASPETGSGALFGFFGMPAAMRHKLGQDGIQQEVISQLVRLFGSPAEQVSAFLYKDWSEDAYTSVEQDFAPLMNFPIYGRPSTNGEWENKIFWAGTETDAHFGGHLEGALRSAERVVSEIHARLGGHEQ